jgi:hypothetical protein
MGIVQVPHGLEVAQTRGCPFGSDPMPLFDGGRIDYLKPLFGLAVEPVRFGDRRR